MNQRWLAIIVGTLGVYLLIHAGMAGYGAFLLWSTLHGAPPEVHETYRSLVTGLVVFSAFGALSVAASIGLDRGRTWGRRLWVGVGGALVISVVFAVIALGVAWTHYIYEVAAVLISWVYMAALARGKREA